MCLSPGDASSDGIPLSDPLPSVRGESPAVYLARPKQARRTLTSLGDGFLEVLVARCFQTNRVTGFFEQGFSSSPLVRRE